MGSAGTARARRPMASEHSRDHPEKPPTNGGAYVHRPKGAFSHSARTAPVITVFTPVTALKTCHLKKHA